MRQLKLFTAVSTGLVGLSCLAALAATGTTKTMRNRMVLIPAGEYLTGSSAEEVAELKKRYGKRDMYKDYPFDREVPKKKKRLKAFYIDPYEVTNEEYYRFTKQTGYALPRHWTGGRYEGSKGDHPVTYVSQSDAIEYAKWAGKRLPTEDEWEKAARSTDGRVFPWGNRFDPFKAALADSDLKLIIGALCGVNSANSAGVAPGDVSPYGVHDMAGNVREWTASEIPGSPPMAVLKGGAWVDLSVNARAAHRESAPKNARSHIIGFRCAKDADD